MKQLETLAFDEMLLLVIKEEYHNTPLMASYEVFAKFMQNRDIDCDRYIVKLSLERLQEKGKISHKWNGKYFLTTPLKQISVNVKTHIDNIQDCTPIAYNIYDYCKMWAVGESNAISMKVLSDKFGISNRELRDIIYKINYRGYTLKNGATFKRKIYGSNNGYFMIENVREWKRLRSNRVNKLLNAVKELTILDEDYGVDNQYKLKLSEYSKELEKSLSDDLGGKYNDL